MSFVADALMGITNFMWGIWTFFVLMGAGILFTIWTKVVQYRALGHGIAVTKGDYDNPDDPGAINHFQALSAALSATVGLGNIGGVALAIGIGGPGALFWMWIIGFLGMAVKTIEVTLALMYRNTDDPTNPHGGAMWVIDKTLGRHPGPRRTVAKVLATTFCVTLVISTMTGGNIFQSWNVAALTEQYFQVPPLVSSIVIALLVGGVIIGGIQRIGSVAGRIVPAMVGMYLVAALAVIAVNIEQIPSLFALIVTSAFTPADAGGAFVGAGAYFAFSHGLRRALFSNEAGQGSAPIAHAAAKTEFPAREGVVAGLGPFIDTILICTLTALVILSTDTWNRDPEGYFQGDIALVQESPGVWTVQADTDVGLLPDLPGGDQWASGYGFYLVAESQDATRTATGSNRLKMDAQVVREGQQLRIAWQPITLDAAEWTTAPQDVQLMDKGVFRTYAGAPLTAYAFDRAFPGLGKWLITVAAWLFALSTMISWSYYGEQGVTYVAGPKAVLPYKAVFVLLAIAAPFLAGNGRELEAIIDFGTGAMLWANMPIVLLMGHLAVRNLREYFEALDAGKFVRHTSKSIDPVNANAD